MVESVRRWKWGHYIRSIDYLRMSMVIEPQSLHTGCMVFLFVRWTQKSSPSLGEAAKEYLRMTRLQNANERGQESNKCSVVSSSLAHSTYVASTSTALPKAYVYEEATTIGLSNDDLGLESMRQPIAKERSWCTQTFRIARVIPQETTPQDAVSTNDNLAELRW